MSKGKMTKEQVENLQEEHYKLNIILVAVTNYLISKGLKKDCDDYINKFLEDYKTSKGI